MLERHSWTTRGGIDVRRVIEPIDARAACDELAAALDTRRGMMVIDDHGYAHGPAGRFCGYVDPPIEITGRERELRLRALNARGRVLLPALSRAVSGTLVDLRIGEDGLTGRVPAPDAEFCEEERTRQRTVHTVLREILNCLAAPDDPHLGLYGAFGYDQIFQFDPVEMRRRREPDQRDLVLHLADQVITFDGLSGTASRKRYEFAVDGADTEGLGRATPAAPWRRGARPPRERDHEPGGYADLVRFARTWFEQGDLFEVVPSQSFYLACEVSPAEVFRRLRARNPAPYGLLANLGDGEFLVGASPEMFVRVDHEQGADGAVLRVRSSPISGTAARGADPLEDADRIRELLNSAKEESELTMCTDVDRNDKARICRPGSVTVVGRREIELYSTLIHTADRVEGVLCEGRDALDALATHLWAVTVTGAPKSAAVEFIERQERSPRRWYGGAFGRLGSDGTLDTGLTLRTVQVKDGIATVRAGATLLYDSDPEAEERETELKALALLDAVAHPDSMARTRSPRSGTPVAAPRRGVASAGGAGSPGARGGSAPLRVLLVDHRDSFVHCLADYLRQTGADVVTYRAELAERALAETAPDLLVLSPGPGRPADFAMDRILDAALAGALPVFGVCLGLQGLVEYLGGKLAVLDRPVHGKRSRIELVGDGGIVLRGLPPVFEAGRYHSLHADPAALPARLRVTARTADGVVMAVEHVDRPLAAIQFHPESIMTAHGGWGHALIRNVVSRLPAPRA